MLLSKGESSVTCYDIEIRNHDNDEGGKIPQQLSLHLCRAFQPFEFSFLTTIRHSHRAPLLSLSTSNHISRDKIPFDAEFFIKYSFPYASVNSLTTLELTKHTKIFIILSMLVYLCVLCSEGEKLPQFV